LIWATGEAVNFVAVWLVIAATTVPDRGLPTSWYAAFSMLRALAVLWLVVSVWLRVRDRLASPADPDGEWDDLAGPMAGADDAVLVRFA
jgi:hypothetical protein